MKLSKEQKLHRLRLLEISYKRKFSHLGSCLTAIDIIDAIYKVKKKDERFILSNGHAGMGLYVILEKHGFLNEEKIYKLYVHPDRDTKLGIDVSTGSLGHGLPIALGMALSDRKKKVYCMLSDGESNEGSVWESLKVAQVLKLRNLITIVNFNGFSAYDKVNKNPLLAKFRAFGFDVLKVNGHDAKGLLKALKSKIGQSPKLIFAKTKVDQFPFLKGIDAHYYVMQQQDYQHILEVLKS